VHAANDSSDGDGDGKVLFAEVSSSLEMFPRYKCHFHKFGSELLLRRTGVPRYRSVDERLCID
jgi:hypothetical protein